MFRRLATVLGPEGGRLGAADGLGRLRFWAAAAIVLVSAGSAVSVLKAAVYDERSSHEDALYRRQLVSWQQANRSREEEVSEDVNLFGGYEQHALHARDLRREALALAASSRLAYTLRAKAEREQAAAATLLTELQVPSSLAPGHGTLSYDPVGAYRSAVSTPQALEEDLRPGEHRVDAKSARRDGVWMAGVAALFLGALVLLTFAQVYAAARAPKASEAGEPATAAPPAVLRLAYALFTAGILLSLVATIAGLSVVT